MLDIKIEKIKLENELLDAWANNITGFWYDMKNNSGGKNV